MDVKGLMVYVLSSVVVTTRCMSVVNTTITSDLFFSLSVDIKRARNDNYVEA